MMHRVLIEFAVDVPNSDVARDVETRLVREHASRICETLRSAMGYDPLSSPGQVGLLVTHEPVVWSAAERGWLGEDDKEDDDKEDDDE